MDLQTILNIKLQKTGLLENGHLVSNVAIGKLGHETLAPHLKMSSTS